MSRALAQFGKTVRADVETSATGADVGTADVLTEISRATDKQLWLVEAHLFQGGTRLGTQTSASWYHGY